jgi:PAS domain S-box-containing protein
MAIALSELNEPRERPADPTHHDHVVQFYDDEEFLLEAACDFLAGGAGGVEPMVLIATEAHRAGFAQRLEARGIDVAAALRDGSLVALDARETLATFMIDAMPDGKLFDDNLGGVIRGALAGREAKRLRAFGEMVDVLWRDGNPQAALRLEELWNDLGRQLPFTLLCGYKMGNFFKEADCDGLARVCRSHTRVVPAESYSRDDGESSRLREIARLQQRALALEHEVEHRKRLEAELREALAHRARAEAALRETQQDLLDFLESAAEGLHCVGPDGTILWANRAELEMFGYSKEEYVGRNIVDFHVDRQTIDEMLARLARNETLRQFEARVLCKDGSVKHVLVNSNALFREGRFVHTRCFTRDVTDRKLLLEEMQRQNEELSRRLHFSEMFAGILGHDLRNPLSAILTGASLLARRADSDRVVKPAARIVTSATRMARMIDQLLDFTRLRLGRGLPLDRKEIDLAEVCRMATDEVDSSEFPRVRVVPSGDVVGLWDGDRLAQLVSNLVGNALTHGPADTPVVVRVDGTDSHEIVLEVHNRGTIAPELSSVVFDAFRSTANRKPEGSSGLGLGLYISKQIALAHGGDIEVSSSEADGTRFAVRLPRTASPL